MACKKGIADPSSCLLHTSLCVPGYQIGYAEQSPGLAEDGEMEPSSLSDDEDKENERPAQR